LVRIGYFANLNHAPAILGLSDGDFQKYLGPTTSIKTYLFTAGPTEMTALLAGQLDMAYVGPSPAVNAFIQSNGTVLRIVAGVSNGGAVFVVRNNDGITSVANFTGKTFAAPQLGNTQDIALRSYLLRNHYVVGTNVTVDDTSNANILTLMTQGKLDGAWVPEPTASELIYQANCHVFLDERSLWPGGNFSTAELVVSTSFLSAHPDVVKKVIEADVNDTLWIGQNQAQAATLINARIANLTSTTITNSTIFNNATQYLSFTYDPLESSVTQQAQNAYELGFLGTTAPNLNGLFDLTLLNEVLQEQGLPQVTN
jgi:NitT/TauT family transport system substrate-binding protein